MISFSHNFGLVKVKQEIHKTKSAARVVGYINRCSKRDKRQVLPSEDNMMNIFLLLGFLINQNKCRPIGYE